MGSDYLFQSQKTFIIKMNYIQQFIEASIKGGWKNKMFGFDCEINTKDHFFIDPDFWECAGKTLGWFRKEKYCPTCKIKKEWRKICKQCGSYKYELVETEETWQYHRHQFLCEHIPSGKSPDEFFKQFFT